MDYTVVHASEWTYPDRLEYPGASKEICLHSARNSYAAAQILLSEVPEGAQLSVRATGGLALLPMEAFELFTVHVEDNPFLEKGKTVNGCPSRWAPFDIYDCLKPWSGSPTVRGGVTGLYVSFTVAANVMPGTLTGAVEIGGAGSGVSVPASVAVYKATVPKEEHLTILNGYNMAKTAEYHRVAPDSAESRRLDRAYLGMLRRMRQNALYARGVLTTQGADGKYAFDFSPMEAFIEDAMALGYRGFFLPSVGWRESWKKPTILVGPDPRSLPSMSYEGYVYLSQYLPALTDFLKKKGWIDKVYQGVADEPNESNATEFRALCGLVRKLAPELRLMDAVSYVPVHGALDVWIPLNSEYDKHREAYESFRGTGDELWHYVCCGPRSEGYVNRFMDYPLLATRYLFWGNYKYGLTGYLHWASNCYQPGQDPFTQNCPEHINTDSKTILPAGDTHIIYPGGDGPWMSMRLEAQRCSAEDYELLLALSKADRARADALCARCFRSFNQVEYDVDAFEAARIDLLQAVSAL